MTMIELSEKARVLLTKVGAAKTSSYKFRKRDRSTAKELVEKELCYYSMDYDHLVPYRYPTHTTGSTGDLPV
jgi:hypothetical protein